MRLCRHLVTRHRFFAVPRTASISSVSCIPSESVTSTLADVKVAVLSKSITRPGHSQAFQIDGMCVVIPRIYAVLGSASQ